MNTFKNKKVLLNKSRMNTYKLVATNENEQMDTQEIEITEEQLQQILNGEGGQMPQMLPDPYLYNYYNRLSDREIFLNSDVDDDLLEYYSAILSWVDTDNMNNVPLDKRIAPKIYINTDGGLTYTILNFIDWINTIPQKVYVIGMGRCFSAGCLLLLGGQKGNRYLFKHTSCLLHAGNNGFYGDSAKFMDYAKANELLEKQIKDLVLEKTKLTEEEYDKMYRIEWFFDAQTALEKGFCDHIITDVNEILQLDNVNAKEENNDTEKDNVDVENKDINVEVSEDK